MGARKSWWGPMTELDTRKPSTGRFTAYVLNQYGAPKLGELSICAAPPMDPPPPYLGALILSNIFVAQLYDPLGRMVLMFSRRVGQAIREYRTAHDLLASYVAELNERNDHFLRAMQATAHFEQSIASACQAFKLMKRLNHRLGPNREHPDDRRALRIIKLWNRSKHFDEDLEGCSLADKDIIAPVWLTNDGIECIDAFVPFTEFRTVLLDLLDGLKFFAEVLPQQHTEDREARNAEADAGARKPA